MSWAYDDTETLKNIPVPFDFESIESISPDNHYLDAAKCFISKLDEIVYLLLKKEQQSTAVWALALALGSKHLEGKSMTEIAEHLGITRAAVSKQAVFFCKTLNLPASPYMAPARKRPGKETELQKAARLAKSAKDRDEGLKVMELTKRLIEANIDKFMDGGNEPVECWGKVHRARGQSHNPVSSIFIKNQYIEKLFNGTDTKKDIIKAWIDSDVLMKRSYCGKQINKSVVVKMGGKAHRGYLIKHEKVTKDEA